MFQKPMHCLATVFSSKALSWKETSSAAHWDFQRQNLEITDPEKLVPGNGVYAVTAEELPLAPGRPVLRGMMNIGVRPTIGGTKRVIEVHLFDFAADIYGKKLQVEVREFIRGEQKFTGLEALKINFLEIKRTLPRFFPVPTRFNSGSFAILARCLRQ
jgi:FAD synthase